MKKHLIALLLLSILTSGCASKSNILIEEKKESLIKSDDVELCPDFPIFQGKNTADLIEFLINDVSLQYNLCANKVELYKKLFDKVN